MPLQPRLGLSETQWEALAHAVDLIIHNGAVVHWLLPYAKLKPANVLGTAELLRLAAHGRAKHFHYVSTTSVFDTDHHRAAPSVSEDDTLAASPAGLAGGYPQSKWVAERMVSGSLPVGVRGALQSGPHGRTGRCGSRGSADCLWRCTARAM